LPKKKIKEKGLRKGKGPGVKGVKKEKRRSLHRARQYELLGSKKKKTGLGVKNTQRRKGDLERDRNLWKIKEKRMEVQKRGAWTALNRNKELSRGTTASRKTKTGGNVTQRGRQCGWGIR